MKQKSTLRRIIEFAYDCRGKMIISIVLGIIGVICGLCPYYSIIRIVSALYDKTADGAIIMNYRGASPAVSSVPS